MPHPLPEILTVDGLLARFAERRPDPKYGTPEAQALMFCAYVSARDILESTNVRELVLMMTEYQFPSFRERSDIESWFKDWVFMGEDPDNITTQDVAEICNTLEATLADYWRTKW